MEKLVAALYVDPKGPYSDVCFVDLWDEARDARLYKGSLPVVAHPPCNRWGKMAPINLKRWGTPIGEDGGCFEKALNSVKTCGGVLEHPAQSLAFKEYGIPKPCKNGWKQVSPTEWVGEVYQSDYGHKATKKTWLYYYGVNPPEQYRMNKTKGRYQVGGGVNTGNNKKPRLPQSEAHLTPPDFRDYLIRLALNSSNKG